MKKIIGAATVFLLVSAFYIAGISPTITSDDSGELAGVTATLGVAHSPGYPVYSLVGRAAQTLFPFANPAYRANLVSALPSAAGAAVAFFFFAAISGSIWAGFWSSLALGASSFFYETATATEVYGLAILFAAGMLAVLSSGIETGRRMRLAFFLWGLSMMSHYMASLWLPAIFYLAWKEKRLSAGDAASYALFAALGITPILLIPIRAAADAVYSWEDPRTLGRFLDVVLRARYGAVNLAQGKMNIFDAGQWAPKLRFLISELSASFSAAGFAVGATGMILSLARKKNKNFAADCGAGKSNIVPPTAADGVFLFLLFAGAGPAFLILANVGVDRVSSALMAKFFYLLSIVWCAYAAIALSKLKDARIMAAAGILLVGAAVANSAGKNSSRNHFTFYDYAANLLKNTPKNSIVIFDRADEMEFCVSYLLRIAGRRPDVEFLDANAGVSKSIYGDDYYKIWGPPRISLRNKAESDLISAAKRENGPVFYATFLARQTVTPKKPEGLLHRSAGQSPPGVFPDEVFALRPPEKEIRSRGLYGSHFSILGDYYLYARDDARAEKNLAAAFYLGDAGAYHRLGYFYYQKGENVKARKIFETIARFHPRDADARLNLGVIAEGDGRYDEAEGFYKAAAGMDPSDARARHNLGAVYWKTSRWREAAEAFERAAALEPENDAHRRFADGAKRRITN
ncbi:MAG: DUF2723 domain-containing protein [Endomicrobiia bacterium]|nr:DUF2723 domain-containing protein [Endomicrobiia bacterium]